MEGQYALLNDWVAIAQIARESIFLGVLFLGFKGVWVFGWMYRDKVRECNAYRRIALRGTVLSEAIADLDGRKGESDG